MLAKVKSSAIAGIDAYIIDVEVDISYGLPSFSIVGLAEVSVRESRERVRAAINNSGYSFPPDKVVVNLAPADVKKETTGLDLPLAMGILASLKTVPEQSLEGYLFTGELSLGGGVRPVKGVLPAALAARANRYKGIVIPHANRFEASMIQGIDIIPVRTLSEVVDFFMGFCSIDPVQNDTGEFLNRINEFEVDFSEVQGQSHAKRAIEVAAAGGHNIMMTGPPGSGKSMMAGRIPTILPNPEFDQAIEVVKIYSVAGIMKDGQPFPVGKPFRAPHHTISDAGMIGGGTRPEPGEVSLAHNGVLFLDELPEFKKNVLEVLRQPLEDGAITISRAGAKVSFPCDFMLVAAMNPCPCGFLDDPAGRCSCSGAQIQKYRSRLSGPLMDRIDIQVEVPRVSYAELSGKSGGAESSSRIRERVMTAVNVQKERFQGTGVSCNARMDTGSLKTFCSLDGQSESLLEKSVETLGLSARAYTRILKISRTIADLENQNKITSGHVAEAIQYRSLDRHIN
ncbi:MAG: YifB family Mg chelatase-like AAA ATPase [Desulfobacteraceae bacterium]